MALTSTFDVVIEKLESESRKSFIGFLCLFFHLYVCRAMSLSLKERRSLGFAGQQF